MDKVASGQVTITRTNMEGGSVNEAPISVQSPIYVDQTTLTGPTRGAASMLGGKRLKFNWDEQSRGLGKAEGGGACV